MKWSEVTFIFFQRFATMMIPKENRKVSAQIYHKTSNCDHQGFGSVVFAWIRNRIRFSNLSGSGSGFQISLDPDPDPVFKFSGSGPGSGFSQDSGK